MITYKEMIDGVNNGTIEDVHFSIKGYGHYRSCHLKRVYSEYELSDKRPFEYIELILTDDGSEYSRYYGPFQDKEKVFHIKGKGRFTLKEVFKSVEIISITYHE